MKGWLLLMIWSVFGAGIASAGAKPPVLMAYILCSMPVGIFCGSRIDSSK